MEVDTQEERPVRWGMGDGVVGLLLSTVLPGVVVLLIGISSEEYDRLAPWALVLLQIPLWASLFGVVLWASRRKGRGSLAADFGLRMERKDVVVGLGCGFAAQLLIGPLMSPLYRLLDIDPNTVGKTAEDLANRADDVFGVMFLFVMIVVAAPFFEELFYRGLWQRSIERRFGTSAGVVLSAVLFGSIHFQLVDTFALTAFGLVAATLAARYRRLGPAIWAHVAFNLTALISLLAN